MIEQPTCIRLIAGAFAVSLVAACSSSDDSNTTSTDMNSPPISAGTVEAALADFPNSLLPRYALSNSEVTAGEVFRRIEYSSAGAQTVSWGVEGATEDEKLELEARYSADLTLVESVRNERLDALPTNVDNALRARYPDAVINDIERSTIAGVIAYAILLDTNGQEIEANYNDNAELLFVEDVEPRDGIPASILAVADAQGVTLPDSEFEITTFADETIEYAVEYENDEGQSLTIAMNMAGDIIRIEHEEGLPTLSNSDTVATALAIFPEGIKLDFATMFSEVTAAEIFRSKDLTAPAGSNISYGIEGVSADELLEIEAIYSPEVVLLEQGRGEIIDALPVNVDTAFMTRYPDVEIDEIARVTDDDGVSFSIVFIQNGEELEANFADNGDFIALEDALEEAQIPLVILDALGAERVLLPILEVEQETAADGSVSYTAEYENETGDSISYDITADGTILSIEHEGAPIRVEGCCSLTPVYIPYTGFSGNRLYVAQSHY